MSWIKNETCYYKYNFDKNKPIIAFDYDDTIANRYTSNLLPNVEKTLLKYAENYNICLFTNQMGISKEKTSHEKVQKILNDFEKKILNSAFCKNINFNLQIFYSTEDDKYRKPMTGMFELMKLLFKPINIDFYCGDAAGRPGDFSSSDLYFANNCEIQFKTPEEIFQNSEPVNNLASKVLKNMLLYSKDIWRNGKLSNPRKILEIEKDDNLEKKIILSTNFKNLIILIGPQGSGKSKISNYLSKKYNLGVVSRDIQKTKSKMIKKFRDYESNNEYNGIIIDNTNPTIESRKEWVSLLKENKKWITKFVFLDIDKLKSFHLTKYRQCFGGINIPTVAIHTYYKKLEIPAEDECSQIVVLKKPVTNRNFNQNLRFVM